MKRTLEQSRTFFKRDVRRGFGRELYTTPLPVIRKVVKSLLEVCPWLKGYTWVDPCAGDGRWQVVIEDYGIKCISYDIEPLSSIVEKQDFYKLELPKGNYFIIGNPPFSELGKFVDKALSIAPCCYFLGGGARITGTLSDRVGLLHRFEGYEGNQKDKRSKIKVIDTLGKEVLVWCCGAMFTRTRQHKFKRVDGMCFKTFRTSVTTYTKEDFRVVVLKE